MLSAREQSGSRFARLTGPKRHEILEPEYHRRGCNTKGSILNDLRETFLETVPILTL